MRRIVMTASFGRPVRWRPSKGLVTRARTLIIDDDAGMRLVVRMLAEDAGCEVVGEAADGAQGVELALAHRPDLVIMDLSMPVMDGAEATSRITAALPDTIVVAWTSTADEVARQRVLAAGAQRLLRKGDTDALVDVLRAA